MPIAVHQKTSANYVFYQSQDTEVVDPFGNPTPVSTNQSSKAYEQQISAVTDQFDRKTVLARIAAKQISGPMRNRGDGRQWDTYDIGFMHDEVDTPAKRKAAYDAVKSWAGNYNVKGNQGTRMFTIQDWHDDGSKPHLRVDVNRVIYTSQNTVGPLGLSDQGDLNKDLENLDKALIAAGFAPMQRAGVAADGSTQNKQGQVEPRTPVNQQVSQHLQNAQEQVAGEAPVEQNQEAEEGPAVTPSPAAEAQVSKVPYVGKNFSNADLLAQRANELNKRMATDLAEYERIKAAMQIEAENTALKAEKTELTTANRDLNLSLESAVQATKAELATRDPELAQQVSTLAPEQIVRVGLETLSLELDTKLNELTVAINNAQALQEASNKMEEELEHAIYQYLDQAELNGLQGKSVYDKVDAVGTKLTKQVEQTTNQLKETASQLRAKEQEWLSTNNELTATKEELTATTADRDAKAAELTKAQADINDAIALLRAAQPDLFKNNPTMENNIRASMEAALGKAAEEKDAREKLETQLKQANEANTALSEENQGLKTSLQTMQEERDTARQALETANQKLEEMTKTVERLTKVESNIERLLQPRVEGWASMSREDALDSLGKKFDEISQQKTTALSQVDFYKEQVETLNKKVDRLDERLDEQRREMQAQLTQQQQAHTQQIAQLIQNQQNQAAQGNVPTQSTGQPRTQENQNNQPSQSGGKGKSVDDPEI